MPLDASTPHRLEDGPTMQRVVGWMRRLAHGPQGKESLDVRGLCERIVGELESGDYAGECLALYYWVCKHIRYSQDPIGIEFVKSPTQTLKSGTGDCDDIATLLAAMLMSLGKRCRFVLAGFVPGGPPTHVFCAVVLPDGSALALDPVANRVSLGMIRRSKAGALVVVDVGAVEEEGEGEDLGYEDPASADPAAGRKVPRTFSVWDYALKRYDYFNAMAAVPPPTGGWRRPRDRSPEGLAARLPGGARKVGSGAKAKGTIAALGGAGEAAGGRVGLKRAAVAVGVAAGAYGLYRWWKS